MKSFEVEQIYERIIYKRFTFRGDKFVILSGKPSTKAPPIYLYNDSQKERVSGLFRVRESKTKFVFKMQNKNYLLIFGAGRIKIEQKKGYYSTIIDKLPAGAKTRPPFALSNNIVQK